MLKKAKEKKGSVIFLSILIITTLLFPTIGLITDVGKAKIIKQDLKNVAQLSVLSCLARQQNTFEPSSCNANINKILSDTQRTRNYQIELDGNPQYIGSVDMTVKVKLKATFKPVILPMFGKETITIREEAEASPKIINN